MATEIKRSPNYDRNERRCTDDDWPCYICGTPVKPLSAHWVHIGGGGLMAVTKAEAKADPSGDMGCFPIGPHCWKKHPELHRYGA